MGPQPRPGQIRRIETIIIKVALRGAVELCGACRCKQALGALVVEENTTALDGVEPGDILNYLKTDDEIRGEDLSLKTHG